MKPRLLGTIWVIVLIEGSFQVGNAQGADFVLTSSETLIINTTTPKMQKQDQSASSDIVGNTMSRTFKSKSESYDYKVAYFEFSGDVTFERGSTVRIVGENALSINTTNGSITVETDITMTCQEGMPIGTARCLGGFMARMVCGGKVTCPGTGPGGVNICQDLLNSQDCVYGANHAGNGGGKNEMVDKGANYSCGEGDLIGGSSGVSKFNESRVLTVGIAGGGAIELVALKGLIKIGGTITANAAQNSSLNGTGLVSGPSGGTIRLKAQKVLMDPKASLQVDGASGQVGPVWQSSGGGGGGEIQIQADEGQVYDLRFAPGHSVCRKLANVLAQPGTVIIRNALGEVFRISPSDGKSHVHHFVWPAAEEQTTTTTTTTATEPAIAAPLPLLNRTQLLLEYARRSTGTVNVIQIRDVLSELLLLSRGSIMTSDQLTEIINVLMTMDKILAILAQKHPEDARVMVQLVLDVASSLTKRENMEIWRETSKLPSLLSVVESITAHATVNATSLHYATDNIAFQIRSFAAGSDVTGTFPDYGYFPGGFVTGFNYIVIPEGALPNDTAYKVIILVFKSVQDGMSTYHQGYVIRTAVLSCTVLLGNGSAFTRLHKPAEVHFSNQKIKGKTLNSTICSYWDENQGRWESDGVVTNSSSDNHVECLTHHLTSFAVLMQHTDIPLTEPEKLSLQIITYIGCGISSVALLITLVIFLSIESLSTERHRIHLNLVLALFLAQILFLSGINATGNKIGCQVVAAFLHYFYTVAFTWMLNEGVHLYLKVVKVFRIENVRLLHYYIFGWGFPAVIVGISAAIKPNSYGTESICWLSLSDDFVWAFIGPVTFIIAINCLILIVVVKTIVNSASTVKNSDHAHIRAGVKGALVLMPLLGVSWISGLLAVNKDTVFFQYVFAITNSFQGFLIFLLHVVFNTEVRTAFQRHRKKQQLSKESDYNASYSSTHEPQTSRKRKSDKSPTASNTSGAWKLKARLSMSLMPRTSRVISVKPMNSSKSDEDAVHVNRAFVGGSPTTLETPERDDELSSLNCPATPARQTRL
ncbi:adhesion G protein-coupled receptor L2 [Nematostella vectensis]|uniref:adhesion G protein-coupled receptor L2 n=1 Tax=Nematostella vectensis TaxID=45351 RepID=UPI00207734F1|nr:adhesion G protein-coupled receptor L2 [Nematostella vectensis]